MGVTGHGDARANRDVSVFMIDRFGLVAGLYIKVGLESIRDTT
jgi:hypothetical protein